MYKVDRVKFEALVAEGFLAVPEKFRMKLDNVAFVVEDTPSQAQRKKSGLGKGDLLFGLYEGVPLTKRGHSYTALLPDKISIFQEDIQQVVGSEADLARLITSTVLHEVAHYFGMEETRVRQWEKRRKLAGRI